MNRPNIFNYAKKELSQDAIMAWFFACLHSNQKEYKQIGVKFINYIFGSDYTENDIDIEEKSPEVQYHKMDIYSVVKAGELLHPIIVEDKTDTFLHSNQFKNYCEKVAKWTTENKYLKNLRNEFKNENLNWGDLLYVYFKSGFSPKFEKKEFLEEQKKAEETVINCNSKIKLKVREIYIGDMISFIESLQCNDNLLLEYLEFLKKRNSLFIEAYNNALLKSNNDKYKEYFSNTAGCSRLFENAFGEDVYFRNELYQGWSSRDLFVMSSKINNDSKNDIFYCFRFESCSYNKKFYAYAFQLQQYRYEKSTIGDKKLLFNEKISQAKEIQKLSEEIISEMNSPVEVSYVNLDSTRGKDGKMLFKVFICENNTPDLVCDFVNKFTLAICQRIEAKEILFK